MIDKDSRILADVLNSFGLKTKEDIELFNQTMSRVGVEASKAGEALRKVISSLKLVKSIKPEYKAWQNPYRYHA